MPELNFAVVESLAKIQRHLEAKRLHDDAIEELLERVYGDPAYKSVLEGESVKLTSFPAADIAVKNGDQRPATTKGTVKKKKRAPKKQPKVEGSMAGIIREAMRSFVAENRHFRTGDFRQYLIDQKIPFVDHSLYGVTNEFTRKGFLSRQEDGSYRVSATQLKSMAAGA